MGHITHWHVHSIPNNLVIYLVNALAMYIFLDTQHLVGYSKNFTGLSQYNSYTKVISDIIKDN